MFALRGTKAAKKGRFPWTKFRFLKYRTGEIDGAYGLQ
jgi:hypothetical protein